MKKYFVIVNPVSGRGLGEKSIPAIEQYLRSHQVDFKLVRTERSMHAFALSAQAARDGYDVVVCASGDGTINETINGLMQAKKAGFDKTALAVLPIGTGNDFAGGMALETTLEAGLASLVADKRRKIDLGIAEVDGQNELRYFGNGVGVGFDAAVGIKAAELRWVRGLISYLIGVIQTVFLYYNPAKLEIMVDDEKITQYSLMVSVMNGKRMGGGFRMTPNSKPDDGLFDLCIAETAGKMRIMSLIPLFIKGTQEGEPEIKMRRAKKVKITALEGDFPLHADGELLCEAGKFATLELLPGAIELVYA